MVQQVLLAAMLRGGVGGGGNGVLSTWENLLTHGTHNVGLWKIHSKRSHSLTPTQRPACKLHKYTGDTCGRKKTLIWFSQARAKAAPLDMGLCRNLYAKA